LGHTLRRPAISAAEMPCRCHLARRQISSLNSGSSASAKSPLGTSSPAASSPRKLAKTRLGAAAA